MVYTRESFVFGTFRSMLSMHRNISVRNGITYVRTAVNVHTTRPVQPANRVKTRVPGSSFVRLEKQKSRVRLSSLNGRERERESGPRDFLRRRFATVCAKSYSESYHLRRRFSADRPNKNMFGKKMFIF